MSQPSHSLPRPAAARLRAPLRAGVAVLLCVLLCLSALPLPGAAHAPSSSGTTAPSLATGPRDEGGGNPASEHAASAAKVRRGGLQAPAGAPVDHDRLPAQPVAGPVALAPAPSPAPVTRGRRVEPAAVIAGRDPSQVLPPGHAPPRT